MLSTTLVQQATCDLAMKHGGGWLRHLNVTTHPSAAWTLEQLREVIGIGRRHRFLVHDRDSIFSAELDWSIGALGILTTATGVASSNRSRRHHPKLPRVLPRIRRSMDPTPSPTRCGSPVRLPQPCRCGHRLAPREGSSQPSANLAVDLPLADEADSQVPEQTRNLLAERGIRSPAL